MGSGIAYFYQNLRTYFTIKDDQNLIELFELFDLHFPQLLERKNLISGLSELLYKHIGSTKELKVLELEIMKSNWVRFISQFSQFRNFNVNRLTEDVREIIQLQDKEGVDFSEKIKNRVHHKFQSYQKLLQIGTKKLSKPERELKNRLKKGRAILVKEFGKQRAHPTLRELLESEASEWIKVLMPVWMLNPAQVSKYFTSEADQFDFAMFDEASQIPVAHAAGTIHRARRVLVAGDDQQMTPQSYFKSGSVQALNLLHQANYFWKKVMLKHHYRSEHPGLIAFSNKHFYNNNLIVYPSAVHQSQPIQLHYCENGGVQRTGKRRGGKVARFGIVKSNKYRRIRWCCGLF